MLAVMPEMLMHEDGTLVATTVADRIRDELHLAIEIAVFNVERTRHPVPRFLVEAARAAAEMHAKVLGARIAGHGEEANDVQMRGTAEILARALAELHGRVR